ncbi:GntR family transcriptional regulator [Tropicimonas sp. IMCC6043]|uniref:GntR family transcriptional regulator n=1 Tax=Tropicimonas sp. IMCC6043 TaxID=2510645 RepID=UPI00101BE7DF|nr:GntR family transcriptional regulator [Tropicimonas sp. IMCC6043]RYH08663.1 GntR family transcriptional regulator [Tropicimonas sp. IMCC6043]
MSVIDFLAPGDWMEAATGPRYARLRRRIEDGIAQRIFTPDAPLPPEREIAAQTGLSRVTVRKAIQELVARGIIVQRQGSGSFVKAQGHRVEQSLSRLTSFTEDMVRRGMETNATWLERGIFLPSPEEVVALALSSGDYVARLSRLRSAGDRPMAIERAALPVEMLPDPLKVETSLYRELERLGSHPVRALQKISAINLGEEEARLLDLKPRDAGLRIERRSYLADGRIVEFTRSTYRGDAYDFVAELKLINRQD